MEASVFLHPFAMLLVFRFSAATEACELNRMRHHCFIFDNFYLPLFLILWILSFLDNTVISFM